LFVVTVVVKIFVGQTLSRWLPAVA
jgi:hypothetical protein